MHYSVDVGYVPDLTGEHYTVVLARLHELLRPKSYLEVGVCDGTSLALARCPSIGVDPQFQINPSRLDEVLRKPALHLFQAGSDDFFANVNPIDLLGNRIDMVFLDGMHRCEFLLRDFINSEKFCRPNSIVVLHDCLPVEAGIANRDPSDRKVLAPHHQDWWAGDVWRTSLLLRRHRPDIKMMVLDAQPTGLVLLTNLNPQDVTLSNNYARLVEEMLSWNLQQIGVANLFAEMHIQSTSSIQTSEQLTASFWL